MTASRPLAARYRLAATLDILPTSQSHLVLDRAGAVFNGHDGLRQFCEARPIDRYVRHACSNIRVDMTGPTTATGTSCVTMFQALAQPDAALPLKPAAMPLFAEYVDDYVLTPSGWKFMQRKIIPVFVP